MYCRLRIVGIHWDYSEQLHRRYSLDVIPQWNAIFGIFPFALPSALSRKSGFRRVFLIYHHKEGNESCDQGQSAKRD